MGTYFLVSDNNDLGNVLNQLLQNIDRKSSAEPANVFASTVKDYVSKRLIPSTYGKIYDLMLADFEKPLISCVLEKTEGNQVKTAEILGISRSTLRKKMKELDIDI